MSFETIISRFGYPALVLGLLLEGETVLVLAAFMARRGYLELSWVIMIGFLVTFASDQFFFWLGRLHGAQLLERRPAWKRGVEKAKSLLGRNMALLFITFRFMYGLRTVLPLAFGMSKLNPRRFAVLNFIGALLWAVLFGMAGYLFGQLMESILADVGRYEVWIGLAAAAIGIGVWLIGRRISRKEEDTQDE
jgi:membrane protein DedA with SNARE-associated domain